MTTEQKAYIAGIIDGEGSIMLIKFHNNQFPAPCVSITSTTLELLTWIKAVTGIGAINHKKNYNPKNHKDCFTYIVKYDAAIDLLLAIEPYLVINIKKTRARFIINGYKNVTPRNGRYSSEMLTAKEKFYLDFLELR